ncbi:M28 family peptidase [Dyadobacter sp. CY356]|uniref:M28 family peptidase n=1 Tax=Dyadobacter sp. CY356 TaxID=2906442 RepID=UPI001F30B4AA|nr:M28 family peptidase [Dyadobacter sp. CY356]MCF0056324.1 M20/M25/M40 family metallo-hydrolase [Dyadobacter sp. CY356]
MRFNFLLSILLSCFALFPVFSQNLKLDKNTKNALSKVDTSKIKRDITYLADDKLKGRLPGKEGYQMAVDYVVDQYKQIGLMPAGENGTFVQKLILRKATINVKSSLAILKDKNGNEDTLSIGKDITILPNALQAKTVTEAQLVFAGYGIDMPGKYSDYDRLDVKGKIVVLLNGAPANLQLPSSIQAHFGSPASKMTIAASKGAVGVIMSTALPTPASTAIPSISVAMDPAKTVAVGRSALGKLQLSARVPNAELIRIFMNSGKNLKQVLSILEQGKPSSFELPVSIRVQYTSEYKDVESYNVIAKIEGTDQNLKNEYVIHTAHLDHVGIAMPVRGDSIYNGAHDNASGVACLLEIARIYKRTGVKPRRSVLIVMTTAEEMGLLGSAYFSSFPTVPKSQIVADVNTDMPTLIAPLLSVAPLGAEHSSIDQHVAFACEQLGIEKQKDPMPEEARFVRSDQYSFVLEGIPALHIKYGLKTVDPSFDLVKFTKQWRDANYHKPSDEITNGFDFEAAKKYVQLNFLISYSIAQTTERPKWNAGDFFGKAIQ